MHAATAEHTLPDHFAMVGVRQPTPATLTLRDGVVQVHQQTFGARGGVFDRDAARVLVRYPEPGDAPVPLPTPVNQQHGPMSASAPRTGPRREVAPPALG